METNSNNRRTKTEKLVQFPAKSQEVKFFDQFALSDAEILRQALHFLMKVDQHRRAFRDGQLTEISAGFLLEWIFPIELDMARRESVVDTTQDTQRL